MSDSPRRSELALISCFLGMIACVPIAQTCLELLRGERVQFTDLFRYKPTASNLRQFEHTLEEKSWFQQNLRPTMQACLFGALGDAGSKGLLGRDNWIFFRPDVRYLVEPDRLDPSPAQPDARGLPWVTPADDATRRDSVVRAIVRFHDLLKARDIHLLVMPVPGKPSVYPDRVTSRAQGHVRDFHSPTLELLSELNHRGVSTVDLFAVFRAARAKESPGKKEATLYLAHDTHWTPRGARLAAEAVARRLRDLRWAPDENRRYQTSLVRVARRGDVPEMTQIPGLPAYFGTEEVECEQVRSSTGKLLIPSSSERAGVYKPPGAEASILVIGDSFCRIYQLPEPQTLGSPAPENASTTGESFGSKRLLPGSAGFLSLLMRELKAPINYIVSDGGAATDVRRRLATNPELLEDTKVVLWEFVERDVALGRQGWEDVPLPAAF